MTAYPDAVLFFLNLACNLLLFGCLVAGGVAVSFRLIKNANPRLRYVAAVAAFLFAAFAPLAATFTGSIGSDDFIEAKTGDANNSFDAAFSVQTFIIVPEIASPSTKPDSEKMTSDFLNNFTFMIAESSLGKIFFSLWILGAVGFVLLDVFSLWQLKKARKLWREASDAEREELDFRDKTRLYFGEESPATIGFFRPSIVLPEHFPDDLSLPQKRCIARHELSHAHWRDPLIGFALRLVRALFWISPALWMLERIAVGERESAADRVAVGNGSEDESQHYEAALSYATTLVSVAKHFNFQARPNSFGANTTGFYKGGILENRIRRLIQQSPNATKFSVFAAAAVFAGSFAGLFFLPIAFQSEAGNFQATFTDYSEAKELSQNENFNNLQIRNSQNEPPARLIKISKNKETKAFAPNQNENQSEVSLAANKKNFQIPLRIAVMTEGKSVKDVSGEAFNDSENTMRKLSEEDARTAGFDQKLDKLSGKVQELDALRKNLGSDVQQARQKAAAQIDSLVRRMQPDNDTGRKPN